MRVLSLSLSLSCAPSLSLLLSQSLSLSLSLSVSYVVSVRGLPRLCSLIATNDRWNPYSRQWFDSGEGRDGFEWNCVRRLLWSVIFLCHLRSFLCSKKRNLSEENTQLKTFPSLCVHTTMDKYDWWLSWKPAHKSWSGPYFQRVVFAGVCNRLLHCCALSFATCTVQAQTPSQKLCHHKR